MERRKTPARDSQRKKESSLSSSGSIPAASAFPLRKNFALQNGYEGTAPAHTPHPLPAVKVISVIVLASVLAGLFLASTLLRMRMVRGEGFEPPIPKLPARRIMNPPFH
jgi:hypothetical protein